MKSARFADILELLVDREVEFIVVGMTAGVLAGAPVTTLDVDIVHRRSPENVDRLLRALQEMHAVYRHDPRRLEPTTKHLASPGHQLLATDQVDLDCLGSIDDGKSYEDLLPSASTMALPGGRRLSVLQLPALIEIKRRAARPKDLAAIPVLQATRDETTRRR